MAYKGFKEDRETPSLNMIGCFRYPLINIYIFIRFQIVLYNDILLKPFLFLFSTPIFNKIYDITKHYILFIWKERRKKKKQKNTVSINRNLICECHRKFNGLVASQQDVFFYLFFFNLRVGYYFS